MFVFLYRVCTHVIPSILATRFYFYVCVVVKGMYTCNTGNFGKAPLCSCLCCCRGYVHMYDGLFREQAFVFVFVLLLRVCTHVRLGILVTSGCVHVCTVVEGMYTCKTGNFGNEPSFMLVLL